MENETPGRFVREVAETIQITSPKDAAQYLLGNVYTPFSAFDQEEMWVLLLNNKNWVTHVGMVYRGTVSGCYVRIAELFKAAVRVNAPAVIVAHNHPSGAPDPSPEDVRVTHMIQDAGKTLDIDLLDHIIVGNERWVSLKERGYWD